MFDIYNGFKDKNITNINIYQYNFDNKELNELQCRTDGIICNRISNNNYTITLDKLKNYHIINNCIYSLSKDNITKYLKIHTKVRNNIRKYIGTKQICWATVINIDYKNHHLVLKDIKINNNLVDHMNLFTFNFKDNKFYKNIKRLKVNQRIKIRGYISNYEKHICDETVYDYCFRDLEVLN